MLKSRPQYTGNEARVRETRKASTILVENSLEKQQLGRQGGDRRIIIEWVFRNQVVRIGFMESILLWHFVDVTVAMKYTVN